MWALVEQNNIIIIILDYLLISYMILLNDASVFSPAPAGAALLQCFRVSAALMLLSLTR